MLYDRNWSSHGPMYLQVCEELEIEPNQCAMPDPEDITPEDRPLQTSLDGFVQATPNVKWSKEGLLEHILEFVVAGDQVCN